MSVQGRKDLENNLFFAVYGWAVLKHMSKVKGKSWEGEVEKKGERK